MSISSSALLVDLNISVWTGARTDCEVSDSVTGAAGAVRGAGKFQKNLMAGSNDRKAIADFASATRFWHMQRTLPWSDKGTRLVPTSLYIEYRAELNARKDAFDAMVQDFIAKYPSLVNTAQQNLGTLFNPNDYPSANEIAPKFGFRISTMPVPESGDFRVDLPAEDMEALRLEYETGKDARVAEAMSSAWEQMHSMLSGIVTKLTDTEGEKRRYHETFVTNALQMCSLLTHLNVTGDPKLERARQELERVMSGVGIDDIRGSADVRRIVRKDAEKMLRTFW